MKRFLLAWSVFIAFGVIVGTAHRTHAAGATIFKKVACGSLEVDLAVTNGTGIGFLLINTGNCSVTLKCYDNLVGGAVVGDPTTLAKDDNVGFACPATARTMRLKPNGVATDGDVKVRSLGGP